MNDKLNIDAVNCAGTVRRYSVHSRLIRKIKGRSLRYGQPLRQRESWASLHPASPPARHIKHAYEYDYYRTLDIVLLDSIQDPMSFHSCIHRVRKKTAPLNMSK